MARPCRRQQWWTPLVGAAVASLVAASTAGPAAAAPTVNPALDRIVDRIEQRQPHGYDVTLITGDTVHVEVGADGTRTTQVEVAPRPDGRHVFTQTLTGGGHTYVIPSDAAPLVASGGLDRRLFDLDELAAQGLTDAASTSLPVIVQYGRQAGVAAAPSTRAEAQLADRAGALPASHRARALGSINAAAVAVTRRDAHSLWSALDPRPGARTLGAGVSRVWLDGRVKASLDVSVPMIGAPEAWAAGHDGTGVKVAVLDTGIDQTHPDLAGRVVASRSFVPDVTSVQDGNGHGTHVASTIAGSGAASGGKYRGVAPGADLVVGKVLDDGGSGSESAIIDGMEWAATTAGARIVSMSLGTRFPSDGTDPMSQAVDDLSASTGALFVVAAGNTGDAPGTIGAPGAADAALTVAAVDKSDRLAGFSSRGPRFNDHALKPDIAAPGVNIVAARAAGTTLNPFGVVDDHYVSASGTSMATPHVAGAAAILAQEHPDWTGEQIKAALTSTSRDDGYTVYQQGAGRVDVAAASRATVLATTGKVDFGGLPFPHTGPPASRTVSYRNTGGSPVTLTLSASLTYTRDGSAAPDGMLTVTPSTLDVPAGGTAQATVTLDDTLGTLGAYSGVVTATGSGGSLRTPVGGYKADEEFTLDVHSVLPDQAVVAGVSDLLLLRVDKDTGDWTFLPPDLSNHVRLEKGVYQVVQSVVWSAGPGDIDDETFLVDPEVTLDRDTSITLDANTARLATPEAERPTDVYTSSAVLWRFPAESSSPYGLISSSHPYFYRTWVTPTATARVGRFLYDHRYVLGTRLISAVVEGRDGLPAVTLHPRYTHYHPVVPKLDGRMALPVVDAGRGTAADFARVDVRGRVALVDIGEKSLLPLLGTVFAREELRNAAAAGAAAVFAYDDAGWPVMGDSAVFALGAYPLPTVALSAEEGRALHDRLARGPAILQIDSQPSVPDLYSLAFLEDGAVPASVHHTVRDADLATLRSTIHADRRVAIVESWMVRRPTVFPHDEDDVVDVASFLADLPGPGSRTEHVGPVSASTFWHHGVNFFDLDRMIQDGDVGHLSKHFVGAMSRPEVFDRPVVRDETWMQAPTTPGAFVYPEAADEVLRPDATECAVCRFSGLVPGADVLPLFTLGVDGAGHISELTAFANDSGIPERSGVDEWHMYRDGVELPQHQLASFPFYLLPPGEGTYRLTEHLAEWQILGGFGTGADTTWTFTSTDPTGQELPGYEDVLGFCVDRCSVEPLLFLRYQLHLGLDNRLPAPGAHTFTVTAYRQPSNGAAMPDVAGMTVSASVDGGKTWTPTQVEPLGDGAFSVTVPHPRIDGPTGTVSLRTEAWDTAGNRVEQTIPDAYGLVGRN